MKHDKAKDLLQDYLDGELAAAEAEDLRRHLDQCRACAIEFERLENLVRRAGELPAEIEPGQDLWQGIEERLARGDAALPAETRRSPRSVWKRPFTLAAAAALVLAVLAADRFLGDPRIFDGSNPNETQVGSLDFLAAGTMQTLEAEVRAADPGVEAMMAAEDDERAEGAGPILENLQIVNRAIDEARRAWKANPQDSHLARMLISAYQAKLALQSQVSRIAERS